MPPVQTQPPATDVYLLDGQFPTLKVTRIAAVTGQTTALGQGYWDWQIAADGLGNVYVQDGFGVHRIDTAGGKTKVHGTSDGEGPWRLAGDWAGNLYVAGHYPSGWVRKVPADGTPSAVIWTSNDVPWTSPSTATRTSTSPPLLP